VGLESQVNAYRTLTDLVLVSAGPVSIPGAADPGYQIEIRTWEKPTACSYRLVPHRERSLC
jgi:hypothetical protein